MEELLNVLKNDSVLSDYVREFRISEPMSITELPLIYVQLSASRGEEFIRRGQRTFERLVHVDICVVDRHVEPREADLRALRLAEQVCQVVIANPTLNGFAEGCSIEAIVPEYGALRDHALARVRVAVAFKVMWHA